MATDDFFRARLDSMIDMRHPLVVLATRTPHGRPRTASRRYSAEPTAHQNRRLTVE